MKFLPNSRNYIIVTNKFEFAQAKTVDLCRFIVWEDKNVINIWFRNNGIWYKETYVQFGEDNEKDISVTGLKAYQDFYAYCGKDEVEKMKHILSPIEIWESNEQLHYSNYEYANQKIYKTIYEFDANSAFTYGVFQLPNGFEKLKEYMDMLYNEKKNAKNKITRSRFKNLQNFLIGYFARIKDFVSTRSEIIRESNFNVQLRMSEINNKGGTVYISNTDSIVTDEIGADVMQKHLGSEAGKFKLEKTVDRLYYKSSNAYQLGDKITYSGVGYFAQKHTDFFEGLHAKQEGSLIKGTDFEIGADENGYNKICRIVKSKIIVTVFNELGEVVDIKYYKLEG